MKYDLLIMFTDGTAKTIMSVSDYGYNENSSSFFFVKNGYRAFMPKDSVKYIGRAFDWEE